MPSSPTSVSDDTARRATCPKCGAAPYAPCTRFTEQVRYLDRETGEVVQPSYVRLPRPLVRSVLPVGEVLLSVHNERREQYRRDHGLEVYTAWQLEAAWWRERDIERFLAHRRREITACLRLFDQQEEDQLRTWLREGGAVLLTQIGTPA